MATYNSNGQQSDVNDKLALCVDGDTVTMPAGSFTWGAGAVKTTISKAVTLQGAGATTIITIDSGAPDGVIAIAAAATVKDFAIIPTAGKANFSAQASGFHISNISYNPTQSSARAYFVFLLEGVTGLIDQCDVYGGDTQNELIFGRGSETAWDSAAEFGTANAVFIEDNTFSGPGYVCDANSNANFVVRFNTINGNMKIDGHGLASNNPAQGVRQMEVYGNTFTLTSGANEALEFRGGANIIFNNVSNNTGTSRFYITDYGYVTQSVNFNYVFQTPYNYPIGYQVGTGARSTINATDITAGLMVRIKTVGTTDYTLIGAASNTVDTQFIATGAGTGNGTVTYTPAAGQPSVIFNNTKLGSPWPRSTKSVGSGTGTTDAAGYAIGATSITLTAQSSTIRAGNYVAFAGDDNRYRVTVTKTSGAGVLQIASPGLIQEIPASATAMTYGGVVNYQAQTGNPSATYNERTMIQTNRDIYADSGFDTLGSVGVTVGTTAQMDALTPGITPYFFWVTDQGDWNTTVAAGTSGLLYRWNGSSFELYYTPHVYPFSGTPPVTPPNLTTATINAAGTQLTTSFSVSCTTGAGGSGGMTMSASGGAATLTYASGSGSTAYVWNINRVIQSGEVITISYVQPGSGIESTSDQVDLADFTDQSVTNASTQSNRQAVGNRSPVSLSAFF